jgi:AraC-like DNA-binding protein
VDVLSDVLSAVQLTAAVFFDIQAYAPWAVASPRAELLRTKILPNSQHVIAFHALLAGSCWAKLPGDRSERAMSAGDLVVVPMGDEHQLASTPGMRSKADMDHYRFPLGTSLPVPKVLNPVGGPERTHFVCGFFGCDARPFNPLLDSLPRMFHASVSATSQNWLVGVLRAGVVETEQASAGGEAMLAKLAELMFVEVMRKYIASLPQDARGWCSGIRDGRVGVALQRIHERPEHDWTVDALAREAGMSRSSFAERFLGFVGTPPMQYLARWRLQRASRLIERGLSIAAAAGEVGYESEAAFNRAFKRFVGVTPGSWRKNRLAAGGKQPA